MRLKRREIPFTKNCHLNVLFRACRHTADGSIQYSHITRGLKTGLLCRPDNSDVPNSLDKIDLLWNQERNVHMQHEAEVDNVNEDDYEPDDPSEQLPIIPELNEAREFLLGSREYKWLLDRLQAAISMTSTGSMDLDFRRETLKMIDGRAEAGFVVGWMPSRFWHEQYDESTKVEFEKILCYVGSSPNVYITTVGEYVNKIWPTLGRSLLAIVSQVVRERLASISGTSRSLTKQPWLGVRGLLRRMSFSTPR